MRSFSNSASSFIIFILTIVSIFSVLDLVSTAETPGNVTPTTTTETTTGGANTTPAEGETGNTTANKKSQAETPSFFTEYKWPIIIALVLLGIVISSVGVYYLNKN